MRYERAYRDDRYPADEDDALRERPLADLLRELGQEGKALVREEVRLAKAELRAEAKKAGKGAGLMGAGGAVLLVTLVLLGATLVLIGDTFLPAWLSALIVTALYGVAGWVLLSSGKKELRSTEPKRAIQSIQEEGRWAKETMRDIRSSRSANA